MRFTPAMAFALCSAWRNDVSSFFATTMSAPKQGHVAAMLRTKAARAKRTMPDFIPRRGRTGRGPSYEAGWLAAYVGDENLSAGGLRHGQRQVGGGRPGRKGQTSHRRATER